MKSKITIHTSPSFKPCIKVVERSGQLASEEGEDVRDTLVKGLRESLEHTSSTFQLVFQNEHEYTIHPVADELAYFESVIYGRYLHAVNCRERLKSLVTLINNAIEEESKSLKIENNNQ